jgi:Flp pilus assembly protein TadD
MRNTRALNGVSCMILLIAVIGVMGCSLPRSVTLADQQKIRHLVDTGVVALRKGDLARAQASFEVAESLGAEAEALDGLGCVAFLRGDLAQAETLFLEALDRNPQYTQAIGNLALLYEQRGERQAAEERFEEALLRDPANARVRNNYALFLAEQRGRGDPTVRQELLRAAVLDQEVLVQLNVQQLTKE